jgi:phosphatidyl-myo-inositol dimannoside synthase
VNGAINPQVSTEVLGVFPSFDSEKFGGVQGSGREAWKSIVDCFGEAHARALFYKPGQSKAATALSALRLPRAKRILIWHLQLVKVLPLLCVRESRVTVFLHGIEAWRKQNRITCAALRGVDLFLSNSDFTWSKFVEVNPDFSNWPHRTVHLGLGLPNEASNALQTSAVLMIGRLRQSENYKGHKEIIAAWPEILRTVPDAELWIVGDGDLRPDLEQLATRHGVANQVRFYGHIPDAEKENLIERCRCMALPSTGEGFGLVYLEAMRLGRPCLVSTVDAGMEVVCPPEAGLAVNPTERAEVVSAIRRLLTSSQEWGRWSQQARRRYASHFTQEHFQQRLLSALAG